MGIWSTGPGSPLAFAGASGGKIRAYNSVGTLPILVVGVNTSRQQLTFHNPGTVDIFIYPFYVLNNSGARVALNPTSGALGGCFRLFANGGTLIISGECQGDWMAFATTEGNALTVMDSNI